MDNVLMATEHYKYLVEQIKATVTEAVHNSRWFLVEGYWNVGKLIREAFTGNITKQLQTLAVDVGISERTLWYALQFFDKYPILNNVPEGKNISWNKLITKYLPEHTEKEERDEYQRIFKGIERWSKSIVGIIDSSAQDKIDYHIREIHKILDVAEAQEALGMISSDEAIKTADDIGKLDRNWMDNEDTSGPRQDMEALMYKQAEEELPKPEPTSNIGFDPGDRER